MHVYGFSMPTVAHVRAFQDKDFNQQVSSLQWYKVAVEADRTEQVQVSSVRPGTASAGAGLGGVASGAVRCRQEPTSIPRSLLGTSGFATLESTARAPAKQVYKYFYCGFRSGIVLA